MTVDPLLQPYMQMVLTTSGAETVSLLFRHSSSNVLRCLHWGQSPLADVADDQQAEQFISQQHLEKNTILPLPSQCETGLVLAISLPTDDSQSIAPVPGQQPGQQLERRQATSAHTQPVDTYWLALKYSTTIPSWLDSPDPHQHPQPLWPMLLQQGAALIKTIHFNQALMDDPLTLLPGRQEFSHRLSGYLQERQHTAMLQINPKNFYRINQKFGREAGDKVIGEIAQRLQTTLRKEDLLSRFGGALFAVALTDVTLKRACEVGDKLCSQLQQQPYLQGAIELDFSIGIGHTDNLKPDEQEDHHSKLLQQSDQALLAAHAEDGSQVVSWEKDGQAHYAMAVDRLSGIFTADTTTDYRNMLLLWDIANITASECQPEELLETSVSRLQLAFAIENAGLITLQEDGQELVSLDPQNALLENNEFCQLAIPRLQQSLEQGTPLLLEHQLQRLYAVPLPDESASQQLFWFQGMTSHLLLDQHAQLMLSALARQMGRALTRARLEADVRQQQQKTLNTLRSMVSEDNLVFCSPQMQSLMAQARRAAQTDITMLISGESGTGKEQLTKAIHNMSTRHQSPLVVVDCSAIPDSLIESELFGHEKGAFTGAHQRRQGRIQEANNGTLMLDEIGELPLQLQSKLLRLVQEKQFQAVGSNKLQKVDVRIIAVTNRDLLEEVKAGRFREDLYYRLNVLELRTPALRDRTGDLLYLCEHFLATFARQYKMDTKRLSADAEAMMLAYSWPGNIRQLQNRLLQAVVLSDGPELQVDDLRLTAETATEILPAIQEAHRLEAVSPAETILPPETVIPSETLPPLEEPMAPATLNRDHWWQQLSLELDRQISLILADNVSQDAPLASWLETELILNTYKATADNARQAAKRLGLAPSTFRRKLEKLQKAMNSDNTTRPAHFADLLSLLDPVIQGQLWSRDGLYEQLHQLLFTRVLACIGDEPATMARLMAVSDITLQRWLKSHHHAANAG